MIFFLEKEISIDGYEYTHRIGMICFSRGEDDKNTITIVSAYRGLIYYGEPIFSDKFLIPNPSSRRNAIIHYFYSEDENSGYFKITIYQHKGIEYIESKRVIEPELGLISKYF